MFNFYSELLLRLQKQFVSEHESDFKSIEDLLEAFMTQYNRGDFNDTIEMKLRDLYEAAEEADTMRNQGSYTMKSLHYVQMK